MSTTLETILLYPKADYQYAHKLADASTPRLTAQIIGIDFQDKNEPVHVFCETKHLGNRRTWTSPECLTPVLRDFSALCTPLEDGTVPAVEVAKLAQGLAVDDYDWSKAFVHGTNPEATQTIDVFVGDADMGDWCVANIDCDWNVEIDGSMAYNQVAIIDYLRRHHFALPVNGKPLVEGVDFIRKER